MAAVHVVDPHASSADLKHEYGFELVPEIGKNYDAIVVAVKHKPYKDLNEDYFKSIANEGAILVDLKGMYRGKINNMTYWSL